jgi:hypothetical protein
MKLSVLYFFFHFRQDVYRFVRVKSSYKLSTLAFLVSSMSWQARGLPMGASLVKRSHAMSLQLDENIERHYDKVGDYQEDTPTSREHIAIEWHEQDRH